MTDPAPQRDIDDTATRLPAVIFSVRQDRRQRLTLARVTGADPLVRQLEQLLGVADIRSCLHSLVGDASEDLLETFDRSAHWLAPVSSRLRLPVTATERRWYSIDAIPERIGEGIEWHGILLDIEHQVLEEQRLRHLSGVDALTGLPNRRAFPLELDKALALSNRHATPLALMLIDLDHFALINDTWGRNLSDRVLCQVAALIASQLRQEDTLARMSEDELALLMPMTLAIRARELGSRLRQSIARHDFGIGRNKVTVSIGIADANYGDDASVLMQRAWSNLAEAKRRGRDQVVMT